MIDTSVLAWDDLQSCDPAAAQRRLTALFGDSPRGSAAWDGVTNEHDGQVDTPLGLTVASMLARVADARVERKPGAPTAPLRITVALAACSQGVVPANQAELTGPVDDGAGGGGTRHTAQVDPALLADDFAVLRQSLSVFQEACRLPEWSDNDYLWNKGSIAITAGQLTWTNDAGVSWRLASWREDASVPPGRVRLVDGPYAGQLWTFTQERDPGTGAGLGVVRGFDVHVRCPTTGCVCP